jgi:hypothetical protein
MIPTIVNFVACSWGAILTIALSAIDTRPVDKEVLLRMEKDRERAARMHWP